jgi:hypothetical protein
VFEYENLLIFGRDESAARIGHSLSTSSTNNTRRGVMIKEIFSHKPHLWGVNEKAQIMTF